MPRATDLSLRLVLARMARLGATASEIARQLDLPLSTVRGLIGAPCRRRPMALPLRYSPAITAVDLAPRSSAGWKRPSSSPSTSPLGRRPDPRRNDRMIGRTPFGADDPTLAAPARLGSGPTRSAAGQYWQRAEHPHDTWEVDAADQKRLANGRMISWLRVVDECSGAA